MTFLYICMFLQTFVDDTCNGGDIHRPLIPKPVVAAVPVLSCRYINISHSPSEKQRSGVNDAGESASVHIHLTSAAAATATGDDDDDDDVTANELQPRCTDASNDNRPPALPQPCAGYIQVGPNTFGHSDYADDHFPTTNPASVADPLQRPRDNGYADLALASGSSHDSEVADTEENCQQPANEALAAVTEAEVNAVDSETPSADNDRVPADSIGSDSSPVTNYAVIVGTDETEANGAERRSLDNVAAKTHSHTADHPNPDSGFRAAPSQSELDNERRNDVAVSVPVPATFAVSSPAPVWNTGGYISHGELLGATPAV